MKHTAFKADLLLEKGYVEEFNSFLAGTYEPLNKPEALTIRFPDGAKMNIAPALGSCDSEHFVEVSLAREDNNGDMKIVNALPLQKHLTQQYSISFGGFTYKLNLMESPTATASWKPILVPYKALCDDKSSVWDDDDWQVNGDSQTIKLNTNMDICRSNNMFAVPAEDFATVKAKLDAISSTARKYGWRIDLEKQDDVCGYTIANLRIAVVVRDWQVLGTVGSVRRGHILRTIESPAKLDGIDDCVCKKCGEQRNNTVYYLLRNLNDGKVSIVCENCLSRFAGIDCDAFQLMQSAIEVMSNELSIGKSCGSDQGNKAPTFVNVHTFLSCVADVVASCGRLTGKYAGADAEAITRRAFAYYCVNNAKEYISRNDFEVYSAEMKRLGIGTHEQATKDLVAAVLRYDYFGTEALKPIDIVTAQNGLTLCEAVVESSRHVLALTKLLLLYLSVEEKRVQKV